MDEKKDTLPAPPPPPARPVDPAVTNRVSLGAPRLDVFSVPESAEPSTVPAGTPLQQNHFITQGYIRLAQAMQTLVDPDYTPGGVSHARPHWYTFAPHASQEAGKGMLGAAIARRIIDLAQGEAVPSAARAYDRVGLSGPMREGAEKLSAALGGHGLPRDVAAAVGALGSAMNLDALSDPRTLLATAARFARLYLQAPGFLPLDKAEALARTLERMLNEGNVAIFSDIGAAGLAYVEWRKHAGPLTPQRVLRDFPLRGSRPEDARRAFAFAVAHVDDDPLPTDLGRHLPGLTGQSLIVAGFALTEQARQSPGPATRDAFLAMANILFAWREQHDAVQPSFSPPSRLPGEVDRPELTGAMTPVLRLGLGRVTWNFSDYADSQRDRDRNPLTSKPTEYNWAAFADRWPAILSAFALGYRSPTALWDLPGPLVPEHSPLLALP